MKAATHTEIYRPFRGHIRSLPLRFLAVAAPALRVGFKRKLPLLLLYAFPAISCIVFSFVVHAKFVLESGRVPGVDDMGAAAVAAMAGTMIEVSEQIIEYIQTVGSFALLVIAWFGAGLVAEDRRLGAHLLYFSRPITRTDYLLGKLCAACAFGALALVVPSLVICSVASFSSPNWSFVTEQGHVILAALGYSILWVLVASSLVLCISSLVGRKTLALAAIMGWVMLTEACSSVLTALTDEARFRWLSLFENFNHIANWMFGRELTQPFAPWTSLLCVGGLAGLCLLVLTNRIRKLEVVA